MDKELLAECKKVLNYFLKTSGKYGYLVKATKRLLDKLENIPHNKEILKLQLEVCMLTGVLADHMNREDIKQLIKELHK